MWMDREFPGCPFERYADDAVIHCRTLEQAQAVLDALRSRMAEVGLELHPDKTKIVYCQNGNRRGSGPGPGYPHTQFTFLGFTFRPRGAVNKQTGSCRCAPDRALRQCQGQSHRFLGVWRVEGKRNEPARMDPAVNLSKPVVRVTNRPVGQFGQHVGRDPGQDRLSVPETYGLAESSPSLRHLITAGGCILNDRRQFSA